MRNVAKQQYDLQHVKSKVRGEIRFDAPLSRYTWFRTGGNADVLFTPQDENDLSEFLSVLPENTPVMPLGVGSNLLIRDGGVDGVVIRFGKNFSHINIEDETIRSGCGAPDISVARAAMEAGISGFEFLRGVPGTIGGAIKMNAGAYGSEIKDIFCSVKVIDRNGKIFKLSTDEVGFTYRRISLPDDLIFLEGVFKGEKGLKQDIENRMKEIGDAREKSQPLRTQTGGSTFKNPDGNSAWKLIDEAGCRGLSIGGARVSDKHCNFLINDGSATAQDIEDLGEEVRRRVEQSTGVKLEWEIKRIGRRA